MHRPRARAAIVAALCLSCCRLPGAHHHESALSAEQAVLTWQLQGLKRLVGRASQGPLVPFDKVLVTVDEHLLQDLLESTLPIEQVIAQRYRVRVTSARVEFEDGFALCRMEGRASLSERTPQDIFADLTLYGALDIVDLDPRSGTLRGRVTLIALDARQVAVLGVGSHTAEGLVEDLGREKLEAFAPLLSNVEIPVAVQGNIDLPGLTEGGVRIEAARLPLRAAVKDVEAFHKKLWISIDVSVRPEEAPPASAAPGAAP